MKKWVNGRHFCIDEERLEKLSVTGEFLSFYLSYMMITSFHSQFFVLQLVK